MGENGAFRQLFAQDFSRDLPFPHHQDPVGEPDDFGKLGGNDDDRMAFAGQGFDQLVDLGFCPDIDAACRLIEQQDLRFAASQRAIMAFAGCRR